MDLLCYASIISVIAIDGTHVLYYLETVSISDMARPHSNWIKNYRPSMPRSHPEEFLSKKRRGFVTEQSASLIETRDVKLSRETISNKFNLTS